MSNTVPVEIKSVTGSVLFRAEVSLEIRESFRLRAALEISVRARANLAGAYLAGAYLAGAYLARANLAGAYLDGANLARANLAGAYLARANLARANLAGANLDGANLAGANLAGAYLARANLARANLAGAKIISLVARATRLDGYEFFGWQTDKGLMIKAGCRFLTPAQYRDHVAKEYPGTRKADETIAILDFIELRHSQVSASKISEAAR